MTFRMSSRKVIEQFRSYIPPSGVQSSEQFMNFTHNISFTKEGKELLKKPGIVHAKAQEELFGILYSTAKHLHHGRVGGAGTIGKTIVGAKGIGKTHAARAFVHVVEAVFDDVWGVYVDAINFPYLLKYDESLPEALGQFLKRERNLNYRSPDKYSSEHDALCKAMREEQKRLFLFVDEVDQVFRQTQPFYLHNIINPLAEMGSSSNGEVAVLICGSSAYLTELIKGKATKEMQETYKLFQHGSWNLNGTKYPSKRVYSTLPTDLETARAIIKYANETKSPTNQISLDDTAHFRCLAFSTGSNVRFVEDYQRDHDGKSEAASGPDSLSYGLGSLTKIGKLVSNKIYERLAENNKALLEDLENSFPQSVASLDWEKRFRPLQWSEVETIWKSPEVHAVKPSQSSLNEVILHLSDRSYVVLDGVEHGHPEFIYPITMLRLYGFSLEKRLEPGKMRQAAHDLHKFARDNGMSLFMHVAKNM